MRIDHVHPTEAEDFENLVKQAKRSLDDFEISATPEQPVTREANVISPVSGSITIKSKRTGQARSYRTGHMSSWVIQAYDDVKAGVL
ncbi:hypothetical protein [Bradyrhizobium sp. ERR14]|uniref:hypothetical protein n=1 Tax=Bradyrhizobium sp. ERR14 TaxID=2663837 RepID=UPI00161888DB|nr:hypothetical protein [Bradyrhizobium sp. ERR14]MBB4398699.1 hypothetical protein [Bradyrhizobium sp. ERR14]